MRACRATLAALLAVACQGARMAPLPRVPPAEPTHLAGPPHLVPGEQMQFYLSWHGLRIARLRFAAGTAGQLDDRPAMIARADIESDGLVAVVKRLRDSMTTAVDLETGFPLANSGVFRALYVGQSAEVDLDAIPKLDRWSRGEVHDTLTTMAALRAWTPVRDERGTFSGVFGWSSHRVDLVCAGHERVRTELGQFPAVKLEGIVHADDGYRFTLWISDDSDRAPLRMLVDTEFGQVALELASYDREPL